MARRYIAFASMDFEYKGVEFEENEILLISPATEPGKFLIESTEEQKSITVKEALARQMVTTFKVMGRTIPFPERPLPNGRANWQPQPDEEQGDPLEQDDRLPEGLRVGAFYLYKVTPQGVYVPSDSQKRGELFRCRVQLAADGEPMIAYQSLNSAQWKFMKLKQFLKSCPVAVLKEPAQYWSIS